MRVDLVSEKNLWHGASYFSRGWLGLMPHRMSMAAENIYGDYMPSCSAGVRLAFLTDAASFSLTLSYPKAPAENYQGNVDVVINDGEPLTFRIAKDVDQTVDHTFDFTCPLPSEKNTKVVVYFSVQRPTCVNRFELTGGSQLDPVTFDGGEIFFLGDSITQGYFSDPAACFANRVARAANADFLNFAIGGARMPDSTLGKIALEYNWNTMFVAYGVNDCSGSRDPDDLRRAADDLLSCLTAGRPDAEIYVLSPLPWPAGRGRGKQEELESFRKIIERSAQNHGAAFIAGTDLLPEQDKNFADGCHPNNEGMKIIAENLLSKWS